MLLKNESNPIITAKIDLTFDDYSTKSDILSKGDIVEFEYRECDRKFRKIGKIAGINLEFTTGAFRSNVKCDNVELVFTVDFSKDFETEIRKIPAKNILDFEVLEDATDEDGKQDICPCPDPGTEDGDCDCNCNCTEDGGCCCTTTESLPNEDHNCGCNTDNSDTEETPDPEIPGDGEDENGGIDDNDDGETGETTEDNKEEEVEP